MREPTRSKTMTVLDASPLTDIRNTRRIVAVVLRDVVYGRPELDRLLEDVAAAAGYDRPASLLPDTTGRASYQPPAAF